MAAKSVLGRLVKGKFQNIVWPGFVEDGETRNWIEVSLEKVVNDTWNGETTMPSFT